MTVTDSARDVDWIIRGSTQSREHVIWKGHCLSRMGKQGKNRCNRGRKIRCGGVLLWIGAAGAVLLVASYVHAVTETGVRNACHRPVVFLVKLGGSPASV